MKKSLIIGSLLAGAVGVYAQGTLNWNENGSWTPGVYGPDPGNPTVITTGYSSLDIPAGTTSYPGGWIGGGASPGGTVGPTAAAYQNAANFEIGLYLDTSPAALTTDILTGTPVNTDAIQGGASAGTWVTQGTLATDPTISGGTSVYVGLAAWNTGGGTIGSYSAAVANQMAAGYNISTSTLQLSTQTGTPTSITPALGLTSFSLATSVPEPSTIALGVIGASAFLMRLRRKV